MAYRKSTIILLIVFLVVVVIGAFWFFNLFKGPNITFTIEEDVQLQRVFRIKQVASRNVIDFLGTDSDQSTILQRMYDDPRYQNLEEHEIEIDIEDGVGNSKPFTSPPEEEEDEE